MTKEYLTVGLLINSNMSSEDIATKLDLLFTRMDNLETNLTGQVAGVSKKLTKLTEKLVALEREVSSNKDDIKTVRGRVNEHEVKFTNLSKEIEDQKLNVVENSKSCTFLAEEYEKLKDIPKQLAQLKKENVQLKQANDDMKHGLEQEKSSSNAFQQYHRQIHHVKLCGVPPQPGEEKSSTASNPVTLEVIKRICIAGNIIYDPRLIDVCHRLGKSEEYNVPILIRFRHKDARCDFFDQRKKLQGITSQDVDLSGFDSNENNNQQRGTKKRNDGTVQVDITPIYMQDHLTSTNKDLLKLAKTELKDLCNYPGYVMDGEVRSKVSDGQRFIPIRCVSDVYRTKNMLSNQGNG